MPDLIIEDQTFEAKNYLHDILKKAEYENCLFKDCNFSETDLSDIVFSGCRFENCNFSMADLNNTSLKDIQFTNCKLLGLRFSDCNDFLLEMTFDSCALNLASFFKLDLKGISFKNCMLNEADFVETNLQDSIFEQCDLQEAIFEKTNLHKADLRTAYNFSIDPELNRIDQAQFSLGGLPGLLEKYNIQVE
jgi:fluoroquinolone resistance protein